MKFTRDELETKYRWVLGELHAGNEFSKDQLWKWLQELTRPAHAEMNQWYLGAMNDAIFIIDEPPRPSTDDINWSREGGPNLILGPFHSETLAQQVVDAHNQECQPKENIDA